MSADKSGEDSEYDDALEVPDSLEITVDENGETVQLQEKEETRCASNEGTHLYPEFNIVSSFMLHQLIYFVTQSRVLIRESSLYIYPCTHIHPYFFMFSFIID